MTAKNKKLISAILIILIIVPAVLFGRPQKAQAQWYVIDGTNLIANIFTGSTSAVNTGHTITNALIAIAKQGIMVIERRLLQEFTKSITGWINSGFHGAPLFLTNSDSFFHDIAKTEIKTLINEFGYDPNRFPFGEAFALNTINAYKRAADADAAYSLSAVMTDPVMLRNYQNNFNTGGWNGFLINTQYPQNNYLGFQMLATDKLARQLQGTTQNAAQKITTTLNQGLGFLSPQTCPSNPSYNNGTNEFQKPSFDQAEYNKTHLWNPPNQYTTDDKGFITGTDPNYTTYVSNYNYNLQQVKAAFNKNNTCPGGLVNTTPGSVAANQIFKALGVNADATALGSMVEGSLTAILNTLMSHFLDQGLNALGSTINGSPSTTDSWNYQGNTLVTNSTVGTTSTGTTLSVSPASVSVFPGNAVNNIIISGGTPPYGITTQPDPQFADFYVDSTSGALTVIGRAAGNTSIVIHDSSTTAKIITLPITITSTAITPIIPTTPTDNSVGTCTIGGHPTDGVTKSDCGNLGSWAPTLPPGQNPWGTCTLGSGTPSPAKEADCKTWDGVWNPTPPPVTTPPANQTLP